MIRCFPLPEDYRDFLRRHNGAHLIHELTDLKPLDETNHVVLFSLEEVMSGEAYKDAHGHDLGSELDTYFENEHSYYEAPQMYRTFYRDHLIIGYVWSYYEEPIRYIELLGIDHTGHYFKATTADIEYHSTAERITRIPPHDYDWQGKELAKLLEEARKP